MPPTLPAPKHAGGRPTKYRREYCDLIITYFDSVEPYRKEVMEESTEYYANGTERGSRTKYQLIPNKMPTLFRFAEQIKVDKSTLLEWANKHPEFSSALEKSKDIQKEFLIDAGMSGASNPAMTIFTAKNVTDMRDRIERNDTVNHQVFFVPRAIAEKHGLQLPEAEQPRQTIHIAPEDVKLIPAHGAAS